MAQLKDTTIDGILLINSIDYSMTDEEYNELLALIGGE